LIERAGSLNPNAVGAGAIIAVAEECETFPLRRYEVEEDPYGYSVAVVYAPLPIGSKTKTVPWPRGEVWEGSLLVQISMPPLDVELVSATFESARTGLRAPSFPERSDSYGSWAVEVISAEVVPTTETVCRASVNNDPNREAWGQATGVRVASMPVQVTYSGFSEQVVDLLLQLISTVDISEDANVTLRAPELVNLQCHPYFKPVSFPKSQCYDGLKVMNGDKRLITLALQDTLPALVVASVFVGAILPDRIINPKFTLLIMESIAGQNVATDGATAIPGNNVMGPQVQAIAFTSFQPIGNLARGINGMTHIRMTFAVTVQRRPKDMKLQGFTVLFPFGYMMYNRLDVSQIDFTERLNAPAELLHGIEVPVRDYDIVLSKTNVEAGSIAVVVPGLLLVKGDYSLSFSVTYPTETPEANVWFLHFDVWDPTVQESLSHVRYEFPLQGFGDEEIYESIDFASLAAAAALWSALGTYF
jgi:hypothetical protein